jgi:hypothetical protein
MLTVLKEGNLDSLNELPVHSVKGIIEEGLEVDRAPQFFFQEWFEVVRSLFSGLGKGPKLVEYTLPSLQEMDAKTGHYHETGSLEILALITALVTGLAMSLRAYARGFGRSKEKVKENAKVKELEPSVDFEDDEDDADLDINPVPVRRLNSSDNLSRSNSFPDMDSLERHSFFSSPERNALLRRPQSRAAASPSSPGGPG